MKDCTGASILTSRAFRWCMNHFETGERLTMPIVEKIARIREKKMDLHSGSRVHGGTGETNQLNILPLETVSRNKRSKGAAAKMYLFLSGQMVQRKIGNLFTISEVQEKKEQLHWGGGRGQSSGLKT